MRIALDAMGTDNCPAPDVAGGVLAAKELNTNIILVGDETRIRQELVKHDTSGVSLEVVHAPHAVTMEDKPSTVGDDKPNSSMQVGMMLVKEGKADAFVTAGNTGAALAIAMLYTLRRIPGIKRPALTGIFNIMNKPLIFLDVGANADSKPEWLVQFAMMGHVYAQNALGLNKPRVGLLSNGEEEGKGNELVRETAELLKKLSINFVGNVEPKEVLGGYADVVVSDGFTGNVLLKTFESSSRYLATLIRDEIKRSVLSMMGGLLIRSALGRVRQKMDTAEVGGAPLLGVNGVVIIGHGSSTPYAIKNAVNQARRAVSGNVIASIQEGLNHPSVSGQQSDTAL